MSHTYKVTIDHPKPTKKRPFINVIRRTRGTFVRVTDPMGCFGFRYAIFRNRASEVLVPVHDLTPETRKAINL